jgi:methylmalonyl-CoA carboxyltransferase 12S subunit
MVQQETSAILETLDQIRAQLAELTDRVARLEDGAPKRRPPEPEPAMVKEPAAPAAAEEPAEPISEEILLAISAGVAAFLGERVRIRQIRVVTSPAWAQQGRVWIQGSHRLY